MSLILDNAIDDPTIRAWAGMRLGQRYSRATSSLSDAFLRLERAGEHLTDLKARIESFVRDEQESITVHVDAERGIGLRHTGKGVPPILSVVFGETIYNLRASLDYLIYALAWLDSGVRQTKTQFLMEDREEVFDAKRKTQLKGLSKEHAAAVKGLQPFNGGDWLALLRDASNQDKHWALTLTLTHGSGTITFNPPIEKTDARLFAEGKVKVKHDAAVEVTLLDGTPVLERLQSLEAEVRGVLEAFDPEFKRSFVLAVPVALALTGKGPMALHLTNSA